MINIIKKEILIERELKKKLDIIFDFCNLKPKYVNGSIRKVDKTNLSYIEPHRIIVKDKMLLVFNYSNDIYIKSNKLKISELEDYLKNMS